MCFVSDNPMNLKKIILYASVSFLAACAGLNKPSTETWSEAVKIDDFNASGRFAVKLEGKGSYANFDWSRQAPVQTITVKTPLGSAVGQLCQDGLGVLALDGKGRLYQADTAEELSNSLLGFELPIQYLDIWASGKRVGGQPYKILSDGRLQQFDWVISRTLNQEGRIRILQLENSRLNIRLVFDEIIYGSENNGQVQCLARK